jgi:hypothetical protein
LDGPALYRAGQLADREEHPSVAVFGGTAYLPGNGVALRIVDVARDGGPRLLGEWPGDGHALDAATNGRLVLLPQWPPSDNASGPGLSLIDAADPARPSRVGFLPLAQPGVVAAEGSLGYVADGDELVAVDIAQPAAPREVARIRLPGPAQRLAAGAGRVWAATGSTGAIALRLVAGAPTPAPTDTPAAATPAPATASPPASTPATPEPSTSPAATAGASTTPRATPDPARSGQIYLPRLAR